MFVVYLCAPSVFRAVCVIHVPVTRLFLPCFVLFLDLIFNVSISGVSVESVFRHIWWVCCCSALSYQVGLVLDLSVFALSVMVSCLICRTLILCVQLPTVLLILYCYAYSTVRYDVPVTIYSHHSCCLCNV